MVGGLAKAWSVLSVAAVAAAAAEPRTVYLEQAVGRLSAVRAQVGAMRRERAFVSTDSALYRALDERIGRDEEELSAAEAAVENLRQSDGSEWLLVRERLERRLSALESVASRGVGR